MLNMGSVVDKNPLNLTAFTGAGSVTTLNWADQGQLVTVADSAECRIAGEFLGRLVATGVDRSRGHAGP
jgi:hypothetical protein